MFRFTLEKNTRVERKALGAKKLVLLLTHLPPPPHRQYEKGARSENYQDWLLRSGLSLKRQAPGRITGPVDIRIEIEDCHPARDAAHMIGPIEELLLETRVLLDGNAQCIRRVAAEWAAVKGLRITIERALLSGA